MDDTDRGAPGLPGAGSGDPQGAPVNASDKELIAGLTPEQVEAFKRGLQPKAPKPDPAITAYVDHKWQQVLGAFRTACFRCGRNSPVIFLPSGQITFGGPTEHGLDDITMAAQHEFDQLGWRFELRRAYCPACKNLGVSA